MLKQIGYGLLSLALFAAAVLSFQWGFARLAEVRQLDRLPMSPLAAVTQGIYSVSGVVEAKAGAITARYSNDRVVYYRYKLEEEYRDSDGNTKTRTIESGESATPFTLKDSQTKLDVLPGFRVADINWQAPISYSRTTGNRTYTEYSIRAGDSLELLAFYSSREQAFMLSESPHTLPTIVTTGSLKTEGGEQQFNASLVISFAAGLLAVSLAALLVAFGIHRYWVFVVIMSIGLMLALASIGTISLRKDWDNTGLLYFERKAGARAINSQVALEDTYAMYALIKNSAQQWPDSTLFKLVERATFRPPNIDASIKAQIDKRLQDQGSSQYKSHWLMYLLSISSTFLTIGAIWAALKAIRFKRLVEFIPTSKTNGLAYGIAELFGMIEVDEEKPFMTSPLNQEKCVAYHYRVEQKRGSGKNARWHTVEDRAARCLFWLEDDNGRVAVNPDQAKIVYPEKKITRDGDMRYSESWLPPYRNVYCLGFAGIADENSDKLTLQKSDDFQFLITTQEEDEVVKGQGAAGFMLTGLALGFSLMAGSVLLSGSGLLTPMDLVKVSLIVPFILSLITAILHYNGIVFLKNRVDKTRADIDTLLQRRHELWPQLLNVVKGHMAHEQKLMQAITKMRNGQANYSENPEQAGKQFEYEKKVVDAVIARVEAYPELKSNRVIETFRKQMQRSEDELALIRQGYNDSVELYNTQIEKLPDVLLAKLFGFKAASLFAHE